MTIVIKYGGNAMTNKTVQKQVLESIAKLFRSGIEVVLVHGGGPAIKEILDQSGISFRFEDGHRVTDAVTMSFVEMALSGTVNKALVSGLLSFDCKAVGISGKDAGMALVEKRYHKRILPDGRTETVDIGFVGNAPEITPDLIRLLLNNGFLPVCSPVSIGKNDGETYNVNADVFAGSMAGALQADAYVVLTDIDGLRKDINNPGSLLSSVSLGELDEDSSFIQGGMIPKIDSCRHALQSGARRAVILNGTKQNSLEDFFIHKKSFGTQILP